MNLDRLSAHPLFCRVERSLLSRVEETAEEFSVSAGETVYGRHSFSRSLGLLLEGELQVSRESLEISRLRAGDLFGAAALFNGAEDYPTTLTAVGPCRLLLIPQDTVRWLVGNCGAFAEGYVTYLSQRIRFLSARLDTVSADRGEGKLAHYLLSAGEGDVITLAATQLCQRIGVGRATLYRAFEVLEGRGTIVREGKTIRILDRNQLYGIQART